MQPSAAADALYAMGYAREIPNQFFVLINGWLGSRSPCLACLPGPD